MFSEVIAKKFLDGIKCKVKVRAGGRFADFARKLAELSDNIEVENVKDDVFEFCNIYYHFIPRGLEFQAFLALLKSCCELKEEERLGCVVKTFVTDLCPNCAVTVEAVGRACIRSGSEYHIYEASEGVEVVPTTFFCDLKLEGAVGEEEAYEWIRRASEGDYESYLVELLRSGKFEEARNLVRERKLGKVLAKLVAHREFIVRLGAMALLESLSSEREIVAEARKIVAELLEHEDERIREDAAMVLGIIGSEEDIEKLEKIAELGGSVAESAEEAIDKIRRSRQ
ncbi:MAG: HEAT repeat domain-containing protein [Archaeoglobaceae archaeon]